MKSDCDLDRRRHLRDVTASALASSGAEWTCVSPEDEDSTSHSLTSRRGSVPRPGILKSAPLVLAATVLLVTGCGQEGDAESSPSPSTSPPTTSVTPHEPTDAQSSNVTPTRGAARAMGVDTASAPSVT